MIGQPKERPLPVMEDDWLYIFSRNLWLKVPNWIYFWNAIAFDGDRMAAVHSKRNPETSSGEGKFIFRWMTESIDVG